MKMTSDEVVKTLLLMVMSGIPVAFMSFDFMYPNISTPSMEKNLLVLFLVSILAGLGPGYFLKRTSTAMMNVILYVAFGYALAVVLYSAPYSLYDLELVLPSFYYAIFFRYTVILLFLFVLGGFMGVVFGQLVRDSISREETRFSWTKRDE
ncbi:MAG: hypothetical protein JW880_08580 [Candidatus Thermoplasmatota archaeon]|nr:hypothetical protein [Candidatus Thermoplasmatota archaeon]